MTIIEEDSRTKIDHTDPKTSAIEVRGREFESQDVDEKIYGMEGYQPQFLNLTGLDLEPAQRISQASVPPGIGLANFGKNIMTFEASSTSVLDFWVVVGDSPQDILSRYADATGHSPMMPDYGLGFWQSKLPYLNQNEFMETAREYKKRELPIDIMLVDYFHWPFQGDWKWDQTCWPDSAGMIQELRSMGIQLVVSVWPTVDKRSENYSEMVKRGLLIRVEHGLHTTRDFMGQNVQADFTNPSTRVKSFWLDETEPEYNNYAFEDYRYYLGPAMSVTNVYPLSYVKAMYDGQVAAGQPVECPDGILNLARCSWASSQKNQIASGLNMGMAGIPWWTTDIVGFYGGVNEDPAFRELLVRSFQFGSFCPVMRLYSCREPIRIAPVDEGGASHCPSGNDNELWSFGEDNYRILRKFVKMSYRIRDYLRDLMQEARDRCSPVIRTLFFEFPDDSLSWEV
ncbi:glycoside hydrolase superfamily [Lipomyces oligophaga]|uniref:glycoside hydrolase superfamily n=1 Tax=Lipomyces oligophaga TaxID=45792 RepID=UPI0034CFB632